MEKRFPERLRVAQSGPLDDLVRVPGSKSVTNRALLCASLAAGRSDISDPLASDDTDAMVAALRDLGVQIQTEDATLRIEGCAGRLRAPRGPIDARGSGTTARFLCAAAALAQGPVVIDGNARMRERPIADLLGALRNLGIRVEERGQPGCPPIEIRGENGLPGGRVAVDGSRSSQFVSALLLAAPCARTALQIELLGAAVSRPYIDLTLQVMSAFGADAAWIDDTHLAVPATGYRGSPFRVEPDATAATYPFAAAAIAGGEVRVPSIPADSAQGDLGFLALLERMGCVVERNDDQLRVRSGATLRGIEADMNDLPDTVMTLAVVALFAEGTTRIRNVANLRIKESDRLDALERELTKLGASVATGPDWIEIEPGAPRAAAIDTYDDHRIAMSFALAGLRIPGVVIENPACVAKTWPGYFDEMAFINATPV